jgi:hypothetical protein
MKTGLLLLFCAVFTGCSHGKAKAELASDKSQKPRLEDVLRQKAGNSSEVLKWLKNCADECQAPDKQIAKDLGEGYQILFSVSKNNSDSGRVTTEQKTQIILGQSKVRSAFLQILAAKETREILETAYRELVNPQSPYAVMDVEVQNTMQATIDRLLTKPQTTATAWYLKALTIPPSTENILDVMEAYKKCLDADRTDVGCLTAYNDLAKFYERPRCRDKYFSNSLQFFAAQNKKDKVHQKRVSLYGKDFFFSGKPTLHAGDMLEATLENLGPDQWEIWFSLRTFSDSKLLKFTEEGLVKHLSLLLASNEKILSEAPVMQKITDGQFRMPFANPALAKEAFEKICSDITPDRVPENLRLKAE